MPDGALLDTLFQSAADTLAVPGSISGGIDPAAIVRGIEDPSSLAAISVVTETGLSGPSVLYPRPADATVNDGAPQGNSSGLSGVGGWFLRNVVKPKTTATIGPVTVVSMPYGDPAGVRTLIYGGLILTGVLLTVAIVASIFGGK